MKKVKLGNQVPTQSFILPYKKTLGQEAIEVYTKSGHTAMPWQELLIYHIMAENEDDLWIHTKFGYSVPRRNGKTEILSIREMWGITHGEHILHTAHLTSTAHKAWERLYELLKKANIEIKSIYRAFGKEHIELKDGGKVEFRTRTSKGGLGEGFDLLIIDEAQEYQDDQESALKYVVSDSKNPQTIFCGTPPTPISSGVKFTEYRKQVLAGAGTNSGWAEWSIDNQSDPHDKALWYKTNPSLGSILTERKIEDEIGTDTVDFNIQRLGLWIRYNLQSAISLGDWKALQLKSLPNFRGKLFVGIKYGIDATNVAMSIAIKTTTGQVFVESIDCRSVRSNDTWILLFLQKADVQAVAIDGASGQNLLANKMAENRLKKPILPTVKEVITANTLFEQALYEKKICHMGQPSLTQVVSNCEKRPIGSNGGFGYKSIKEGMEVALLDSIILAYWLAYDSKDVRKQKFSY